MTSVFIITWGRIQLNIPCEAEPVQRSNDPTGLEDYVTAGSSAILGFTATNSITVASDRRVYVLTGGTTNGVGATTLDVYDRITSEQLSSGWAPVDRCSGPVEIIDDPTSSLDAQPIQ